jgi:hypothetical protein
MWLDLLYPMNNTLRPPLVVVVMWYQGNQEVRQSNSRSLYCISLKMRKFFKSPFDKNLIMINHKFNSDFKSHITLGGHKRDL